MSKKNDSQEIILEDIDFDQYTFYCNTTQSIAIKLLSEAIKDFTDEVNILLTEKAMSIEMTHKSQACLGKIVLVGEQFEIYHCPYEFFIGIQLKCLYLALKSISDDGILSMYIYKNDSSKMYLKYCNKGVEIVSTISHITVDYTELENFDVIPFSYVVNMPVKEFQKNIKDLNSIHDHNKIKICVEDGKFIMSSVPGPVSMTDTKMTFTSAYDISIEKVEEDENIPEEYRNMAERNIYIGKLLSSITKSGNVSTTVDIMICKQPLVLIYSIGTLGSIKYIIMPMCEPDDED